MANDRKSGLIGELRQRFGEFKKLPDSQSLLQIGNDAARVYLRYSKLHEQGRAFFGLRQRDLRELEGHNSFLCFFLDDESTPLFVPFADFEQIFREAQVASDGQYKVGLILEASGRELYIPRKGRFNVEAYSGFAPLERSLAAGRLDPALDLTHSQVQTLLAGLGNLKGFDVFVPSSDVGRIEWSLTPSFRLRQAIPGGYNEVCPILSEIDVVWIGKGRDTIEGLFEVEHSTSIYSGLLRFNDVLLTDPKLSHFSIVSDDNRRDLFARQVFRPTFRRSGLTELVSFLEYRNVFDWHSRISNTASAAHGVG